MIQNILVPTDFSDNAQKAISFAVNFAEKAQARLFFVYSLQPLIPTNTPIQEFPKVMDEFRETSQNNLMKVVDEAYAALGKVRKEENCRFILKEGPFIVENICEAIKTYKIDLVIMGTQGASGLKKMIFGSNTVGVIEKSDCPVLVIPPLDNLKEIKKIAYATDFSHTDEEFKVVLEYAKILDASVEMVYIFPVYPPPAHFDIETFYRDAYVEQLRKKFDYQLIQLYFMNGGKENNITNGIDHFVKYYKPQLLIMFTKKRGWFDKIFDKSMTKDIAFHSRVPLLSIKTEE